MLKLSRMSLRPAKIAMAATLPMLAVCLTPWLVCTAQIVPSVTKREPPSAPQPGDPVRLSVRATATKQVYRPAEPIELTLDIENAPNSERARFWCGDSAFTIVVTDESGCDVSKTLSLRGSVMMGKAWYLSGNDNRRIKLLANLFNDMTSLGEYTAVVKVYYGTHARWTYRVIQTEPITVKVAGLPYTGRPDPTFGLYPYVGRREKDVRPALVRASSRPARIIRVVALAVLDELPVSWVHQAVRCALGVKNFLGRPLPGDPARLSVRVTAPKRLYRPVEPIELTLDIENTSEDLGSGVELMLDSLTDPTVDSVVTNVAGHPVARTARHYRTVRGERRPHFMPSHRGYQPRFVVNSIYNMTDDGQYTVVVKVPFWSGNPGLYREVWSEPFTVRVEGEPFTSEPEKLEERFGNQFEDLDKLQADDPAVKGNPKPDGP